ncbi:MAG: adenine deaminase [Bacteroidota bacterium]
MKITKQFVDLQQRKIYPAEITVENGHIKNISPIDKIPDDAGFIMPGFVDAHVHIESSMMPPTEFARLAVVHGTVATVSDPHEIANVTGAAGVKYMLEEAKKVPLKFCFGAPSCVPATTFETAGDTLDSAAVESLLNKKEIGYLSEMMNFPGVLFKDEEVLKKIALAQKRNKPIDGHAPGLRGNEAKKYFAAGITTDHECFTYEEGKEKAEIGVKILIREGSAAKNFEALWPLIKEFPEKIMFCSDDKHPDDLIQGHINQLVARAIDKGCDLFDVLRAACIHPVEHYQLKVGLLKTGDPADFIIVNNLSEFKVVETYIDGKKVAENGTSLIPHIISKTPNKFKALKKKPADFFIASNAEKKLRTSHRSACRVKVIQVLDGEIVTNKSEAIIAIKNNQLTPDPANDILKITVVNRYTEHARPAIGFVKGFGIKKGALASSVAHDSHNIVAVGSDDELLCQAVNAVIEAKGGISAVDENKNIKILPLPIAGLMSPEDGYVLAEKYSAVDAWTKNELGCTLTAPFMTLSFLALPVIPALKMTDLGLFDVEDFKFTTVEENE